ITIQRNQMVPIPYDQMIDKETGRTEVRMVNLDSFHYQSAYKAMTRLKPEHAQDAALIERLANQTNLTVKEYTDRYGYLMGVGKRPF
ncbi:MAG TPA: hypothetical protein VF823_01970, partial [Anaerolineales bacterium]